MLPTLRIAARLRFGLALTLLFVLSAWPVFHERLHNTPAFGGASTGLSAASATIGVVAADDCPVCLLLHGGAPLTCSTPTVYVLRSQPFQVLYDATPLAQQQFSVAAPRAPPLA